MSLRDWAQTASRVLEREGAVVRVLLAQVRGSAPREPGVAMLVSATQVAGTIGGGELEWQALTSARTLLADTAMAARLQRQVLGTDLGQCCGGVVELWMERYTRADLDLLRRAQQAARQGPALLCSTLTRAGLERRLECRVGAAADTDRLLRSPRVIATPLLLREDADRIRLLERLDDVLPPLWLYGAGHVGQALVRIMTDLPVRLTWIDSRQTPLTASLPEWVQVLHGTDPLASFAHAPADAHHLVMTHSHALDYALCRAILLRGEFASLGLIGSASKAARFRSRLRREGLSGEQIARLECPIGLRGIVSKWPAAIAVGVAARLMQQISQISLEASGAARAIAPAPLPSREPVAEACAAGGCEDCSLSAVTVR